MRISDWSSDVCSSDLFDGAANALYHFVWNRFCDWYLELIKPVLSNVDGPLLGTADGPATGPEADEPRAVAGWVLDQILVLLHPFMPFITEELWHAGRHRHQELLVAHWSSEERSVGKECISTCQ